MPSAMISTAFAGTYRAGAPVRDLRQQELTGEMPPHVRWASFRGRPFRLEALAWKIHEELAGADQAVEIV
jgi:hypothetical protein